MEGCDSRRSYRLPNLQMKEPARIDGAQFLPPLCISRPTMRVPIMRASNHASGGASRFQGWLTPLFQEECADNPDRLRDKTSLRLRLWFSGDGGYPEFRPNIPQFAEVTA